MIETMEKEIKLFSGEKIKVNFENLREYRKYQTYKLSQSILFILSIALLFVGIVFFYMGFEVHTIYMIYSLIVLSVSLAFIKLVVLIIPHYKKFKYKLIIRQIKNNGWKIENSNNKTGHIKYSIDGEGFSVYVFNKRTK